MVPTGCPSPLDAIVPRGKLQDLVLYMGAPVEGLVRMSMHSNTLVDTYLNIFECTC